MKIPNYLKKAIAEFFRVVVLAIIPVLISGLKGKGIDPTLIWVTGAIAGLRFIDKVLHEYGKEKDIKKAVKGLVRF